MTKSTKAALLTIRVGIFTLFSFASYGQNKDSMLRILPSIKNEADRIHLIYSIIDPDVNNLSEILAYNEKILALSRKYKDKVGEALAIGVLGYALSSSGNTAAGTELQFKALEMAEEVGSHQLAGMTYNGLAVMYSDNVPKARSYLFSAITASTVAKDSLFLEITFSNLASLNLKQGKMDYAAYYNQRSMDIATARNKPIPNQLVRAGQINFQLGRKELAREFYHAAFQEASRDTDDRRNSFYKSYVYSALSNFFLTENRLDSALHYAQLHYQNVKDFYFFRRIPAIKSLWKAYEKANTDSALKYATLYYIMKDSMYSVSQLQQMQALALLEDDRQQKAVEERKHNLQYAAIAFGLVTLLVGFLVLSHSVIANQRLIKFLGVVSLLIIFEFSNLLLHPWLGAITHHSPVLMLLAMVCVAALLVPLHHKIEHWTIHKLVKKNNRIKLAAAKKTIAQLEGKEVGAPVEKSTNAQQGL